MVNVKCVSGNFFPEIGNFSSEYYYVTRTKKFYPELPYHKVGISIAPSGFTGLVLVIFFPRIYWVEDIQAKSPFFVLLFVSWLQKEVFTLMIFCTLSSFKSLKTWVSFFITFMAKIIILLKIGVLSVTICSFFSQLP